MTLEESSEVPQPDTPLPGPPVDDSPQLPDEGDSTLDPTSNGKRGVRRRVALFVVAPLVVFLVAFAAGRASGPDPSTGTAATPNAGSGAPGSVAPALAGLVVQPQDTTSALSVHLLNGGSQVDGQPTLDLCNGSFPSESLRTSRLQDVALDAGGQAVFSTEAVQYRSADATAQAFKELADVASNCPTTPVVSPSGEPTVTTKFGSSPDSDWPKTHSVQRLAYSFTTTDDTGRAVHSIAVYLRRDRFLVGLYFTQPDAAQPAISGQTSIKGIVDQFEGRLAKAPIPADHA